MKSALLTLCALPLLAQPAASVKLPPYQRQVLSNGAVLLVVPKPDVPLVTLEAVFRGGAESDPPGRPGFAGLAAEMLSRGTASRTAVQFNEELDSLGAQMTIRRGRSSSTIGFEFLSRTSAKALQLFEDALRNPAFAPAEFDKARAEAIDGVKGIKDNPPAALSNYLAPFFYPAGHPYARIADEISLAKITRDELAAFHKKMFVGRNLILIAAGDIDAATLTPKLAALAGSLPAGEQYVWAKPSAVPRFDSPRLLLIDKPDATQTYFAIAAPGLDIANPDRVPLRIVNTLFGGRFTSMLNDELRVNSGLTYGASSRVDFDRLPGAISIVTYTKTETTRQAIDLALTVLQRLRDQGITAEQLASAKAYVKGGYPSERLETAAQLAHVLGEMELHGLGRGEVDDLFSRIDAVSLEQANTLAKRYYLRSNLQFVLIGNAAKIKDDLASYAPKVKIVSGKEPGFTTPLF